MVTPELKAAAAAEVPEGNRHDFRRFGREIVAKVVAAARW